MWIKRKENVKPVFRMIENFLMSLSIWKDFVWFMGLVIFLETCCLMRQLDASGSIKRESVHHITQDNFRSQCATFGWAYDLGVHNSSYLEKEQPCFLRWQSDSKDWLAGTAQSPVYPGIIQHAFSVFVSLLWFLWPPSFCNWVSLLVLYAYEYHLICSWETSSVCVHLNDFL